MTVLQPRHDLEVDLEATLTEIDRATQAFVCYLLEQQETVAQLVRVSGEFDAVDSGGSGED